MFIKIKRIDNSLPLPEYKTNGAAAFDFVSREAIEINPSEIKLIPLNSIIKIPENNCLLIFARSSMQKRGLILANGVGIIDSDYCGPEDEIKAAYYNFSNQVVKIEKGERVAQGMILPIEKVNWEEIEEINSPTRGGFGSTGA